MLANIKLHSEEIELRDGSRVTLQVQGKPSAMMFVEELAKRHPTWTFTPNSVSRDYKNVDYNGRTYSEVDSLWAYEFTVTQGKDILGRLGAEYWGGNRFFVTNDRIMKERQRGSVTRTKDLKKALKLVSKMFFPKTDKELVKEITIRGKDILGNYRYRKQQNFHDIWRNMNKGMLLYIRENLAEFRAFTAGAGMSIDGLENFETAWQEKDKSSELEKAYAEGRASMVTLMGDVFYFTFKDTPAVSFHRDEVTPEIKTKVGMLKLVANGEAIDNVGFKCEEDVFVINMLPNIVRQGGQSEAS
jgi:hypothetical protein